MTPEIKQRIEQIRRGGIPEGYQKTALGIAPKSWDRSQIGKICSVFSVAIPDEKPENSMYIMGYVDN